MTISLLQTLQKMADQYNPTRAGKYKDEIAIQFMFSGSEKANHYLQIKKGKCSLHQGQNLYPKLTLKIDSELWLGIWRGELNWTEQLMQRKFIATGDFPLLAKLPEIFGPFTA